MQKIIILMAFISLCLSLGAIGGRVQNSQGFPLEAVCIHNNQVATFSDEKGNYSVTFAADSLHFQLIGYQKISYAYHLVPEIVVLQKKAVAMAGITAHARTMLKGRQKISVASLNNYHNLSEVLSEHVQINRPAGSNQAATVSLLGSSSKHTTVMLDGVVLNMSGQAFDISTIPLAIIKEIEIIPANSKLGGNIGGVINIISRQQATQTFSLKSALGAYDYRLAGFGITHQYHSLAYFINAATSYTKQDFAYQNPFSNEPLKWHKRQNNFCQDRDLSVRLNYQLLKLSISAQYIAKYIDKGLPGDLSNLKKYDRAHKEIKLHKFFFNTDYQYAGINLSAKLHYFDENNKFDNSASSLAAYRYRSYLDYQKKGLELAAASETKYLDYQIAYQHKQENYRQAQIQAKLAKKRVSLAGERQFLFADWAIEPSFSYQYHLLKRSSLKQENLHGYSGGLTGCYDAYLSYQLGLNSSLAHNIPSFHDLYWQGDAQAVGNPNLLPEKSRYFSAFFQVEAASAMLKITYHQRQIKNLIYWFKSVSVWKPENLAAARINNWQIEAAWQAHRLVKIGGQMLITKSADKTTLANGSHGSTYNNDLIYTPHRQLNTYAQINYKKWQLRADYQYIGEQHITRDQLIDAKDAYGTLGGELRYQHTWGKHLISAYLRCDNALDNKYQEYSAIPVPGIHLRAGFTYQLKIKEIK